MFQSLKKSALNSADSELILSETVLFKADSFSFEQLRFRENAAKLQTSKSLFSADHF